MINTVYVIVDCCSGEDYSTDEPNILFTTTDYEKAKQFFMDEISNWEDGMTNYDSNVEENIYECTDFEGNSHRIMKLIIAQVIL